MRHEPNPFIGVNYWDTNANMAVPPKYWLQRLYDFDNMLVVFPSVKVPHAYVLARRRQRTAGMTDKALIDTVDQPETKFCLLNGLVPVSLIFRTGVTWSIDNVIADLKSRDIWAHGGGEKVADTLDAADAAQEKKVKAENRDRAWHEAGDMWRSYQARTGQRTRPTLGQSRQGTATTNRASGSTGNVGSGIILATR